jgi:hypothetical protein
MRTGVVWMRRGRFLVMATIVDSVREIMSLFQGCSRGLLEPDRDYGASTREVRH